MKSKPINYTKVPQHPREKNSKVPEMAFFEGSYIRASEEPRKAVRGQGGQRRKLTMGKDG